MGIEQTIADAAHEMAEQADSGAMEIQRRIDELEAQKRELQGQLATSTGALANLKSFQVRVGPNYQCPRCYVRAGKRSDLTPIPSESRDDWFRCHECGLDLSSAGY